MEDKILVLRGLLEKAYRVESSFENEASFRAFMGELSEEQRGVLFKLMKDSEKHKVALEKIAADLKLNLDKTPEKFEFKDSRIFNEIYRLELSAKALYEYIATEFEAILGENTKILRDIAKEEEGHAKLVEKFVDRTLRIL